MKLNKLQIKILIVSLLIFTLMGIFPPWTYVFDYKNIHTEKPAGYALIIEPPEPEEYKIQYGVQLDIARLSIQWLILLSVTASATLLTRTINKNE